MEMEKQVAAAIPGSSSETAGSLTGALGPRVAVDHMAFAVRDLESAKERMRLYGATMIVEGESEEDGYRVAVMRLGANIWTLLNPTRADSFVADHLNRRGEGLHHVGVEVEDLDAAIDRLARLGIKTHQYKEIPGVRKEALIGPKHAFGTVFQLMEWMGEFKSASPERRMKTAWK